MMIAQYELLLEVLGLTIIFSFHLETNMVVSRRPFYFNIVILVEKLVAVQY